MLKEVISTERLILRNMILEDSKDVYHIWSTEDNSKYMCDPVKSVTEVEGLFSGETPRENYLLAVTDKTTSSIIGTICFGPTDDVMEWGFGYSFDKSSWGKGYATETVKAIIDYGISLGIKKFVSDCASENIGSSRVLRKCGMILDHNSSYLQPESGIVYESLVYKLDVL